jgi:hypothetical protein
MCNTHHAKEEVDAGDDAGMVVDIRAEIDTAMVDADVF